jgi:hypothetical protein
VISSLLIFRITGPKTTPAPQSAGPSLGNHLILISVGGDHGGSWMRNWLLFLLEYLGNIEVHHDRRRDRKARVLMDHIKDEMARQGLVEPERRHRVERLRETVRAAEGEQGR